MLATGTSSVADEALRVVDARATWSPWRPFATAATEGTSSPGVYTFRNRVDHDVVHVGMARERKGAGVRGRLRVYRTGKGAVSGLGEAALDRALADPT